MTLVQHLHSDCQCLRARSNFLFLFNSAQGTAFAFSSQRMLNGHTTRSLTEKPTQISFVAATWSRWRKKMGWYSTKLSVYPFWITSWPLVTWYHLKPTNRVSPFGKVQYWNIKYQTDTCEVTVVFSLRKPQQPFRRENKNQDEMMECKEEYRGVNVGWFGGYSRKNKFAQLLVVKK